jgi:fructokinase
MNQSEPDYFIGLETGGSSIRCCIASGPFAIVAKCQIPTTKPEASMDKVIAFIQNELTSKKLAIKSMGIASFGPVDLHRESPTYGSITSTPKLEWQDFPLVQYLKNAFSFPIAFDTDVNAAALAELKWGAGSGLSDLVYVTVGTGIGGGVICNHQLVHGVIHPEIGHMRIRHDTASDPFGGNCPFHQDCLEGLASGSAMEARWGVRPNELPHDHAGWELEAQYLAQMALNLTLTFSPQRIIIGGGISQHSGILPKIRSAFQQQLNDYLRSPLYKQQLDSYIVAPKLGQDAGILGAIALAQSI